MKAAPAGAANTNEGLDDNLTGGHRRDHIFYHLADEMTTPGATRVPDLTWRRLTEFATAVVDSPTMAEQLTASQGLLEQATVIRWRLVLAAHDAGLSLAEIGRTLNMSPEGARKLRLAALKELEQ